MPADDEWYYERRRIPITRGWGPCKQTDWVPVEEFYQGRNSRTVRTFLRAVGLNPDSSLETRAVDRFRPIVHLDGGDDDANNNNGRDFLQYAGYRERELHAGPWRWHPVGGPPAPAQIHEVDRVIANDLQELEQFRAQRFEHRIGELNAQINEIGGRYQQQIQEYHQALAAEGVGPQRELREVQDALRRMRQDDELRRQEDERREVERRVNLRCEAALDRLRTIEQVQRDLRLQQALDRARHERDYHRRRHHRYREECRR
ncbi:hypothetical protein PV08_10396 [Exophiala spinifera]|uniref:Uncharacterized protein n=1 Tax=Exophiala spinifera TaxID=91928 RepID=A0A0D1ZDN1_9EURO|nr:uncharacterized protein PV08_10396 [Exophiala spinifera]KIW11097.1 hypothetical protein PV08_10396 [Exophiala spinifera]